MREIKFRIWDKEENKFFEPIYEAYKGKLLDLHIDTNGTICRRTLDKFEHESMFPDKYELLQFTGLRDKNGKEIYEGDIVEYYDGTKAKVIFKEGGFCGYDGYATSSDEAYLLLSPHDLPFQDQPEFTVKVVGNIYEDSL